MTALGKKAVDVIGKPEYWHSFPSGHAALAFLLFGSLFFGKSPKAIWVSALIYALLVAWSRIAVGAHFPTDVIGGAFIGLVGAGLAMLIYHRTACGRTTG
nr:phosphatase PAP2 family protein [Acidithiobacillus ferrivorans]